MSLAAPEDESADMEALQRAQRAHEPSMEEILASIRAIIADDNAPPKAGPQLVYQSDAPPRPQSEPVRKPEPAEFLDDEPIVSPDAGAAVSASFRSLSETMAAHSAKAAQDMAREMLRPMLKSWLDENLPAMVERLVKTEIERLARSAG